jgi:hypothetical protein
VNKVSTKVDMRFSLDDADWLDKDVIARLKELFPNAINNENEVFTTSQKTRS